MQDIRWRAFWLILSLTLICLIIWEVQGAELALLTFAVSITLYLFHHLYWLDKLIGWYKKPDLISMPIATGAWEDIFATIYHEQRRHNLSKVQLSAALERFRHAASALPDGVILLDDNNKIEWCNKPAEEQLGLLLKQDINKPIVYLVRNAEFIKYLEHHVDIEPIKLKSWIRLDITLEIQLVAFGSSQKLLICRDVSNQEKLEHMRRDFMSHMNLEPRLPSLVAFLKP